MLSAASWPCVHSLTCSVFVSRASYFIVVKTHITDNLPSQPLLCAQCSSVNYTYIVVQQSLELFFFLPVWYTCCFHLLSCVWLLMTSWTAGTQASLSFTITKSLLKFMPIESVMPSNHLILSSLSSPALNLSQHYDLFQWVSSLHQVPKVLELQFSISPSNE